MGKKAKKGFNRILLKLSGEALMAGRSHGIDPERLQNYIDEIVEVSTMGTQVGIVIGGGNIFRGISGVEDGFDRVKGDYMGMLATVINGLALQSAFESKGKTARHFTDPIDGDRSVRVNRYKPPQTCCC